MVLCRWKSAEKQSRRDTFNDNGIRQMTWKKNSVVKSLVDSSSNASVELLIISSSDDERNSRHEWMLEQHFRIDTLVLIFAIQIE